MSEMQIERVLETCLYGHDLERAACFWWDVLGMVPLSMEAGRHHLFRSLSRPAFISPAEVRKATLLVPVAPYAGTSLAPVISSGMNSKNTAWPQRKRW